MNFIEWIRNMIRVEDNLEKRDRLINEYIQRPKTQQLGLHTKRTMSQGQPQAFGAPGSSHQPDR